MRRADARPELVSSALASDHRPVLPENAEKKLEAHSED